MPRLLLYSLLPLTLLAAAARAAGPVALTIEPCGGDWQGVFLDGGNRQQQLLVTARLADGRLQDVTHECRLAIDKPGVARLAGALLIGVSDGAAELQAQLGEAQARAPVRVLGLGSYPAVHFVNDVMPLFAKHGCNSAACHGKASGQNGFKLSVFGFDSGADYQALANDGRGRRVFPASPAFSLLLRKSTGQVPHGGGRRIERGSADYETLRQWIAQGMPRGRADAPRMAALRVSPPSRVMRPEANQQILATAIFSDGTARDVTAAASYASNSPTVADVDRTGRVHTGHSPGEAAITVHYMGHVAAVRIQVPRTDVPSPYPSLPANNRIDELVWAKLRTLGIVPADLCDDLTFLRRSTLDVIGTLPTPEEVRRFQRDKRPDKRTRWIDELLTRDEYADYWALKFADILLVNRDKLGDRGAYEFHRWLRRQFAHNRPYDAWVRELLTASGPSGEHGPVNFFRAAATPEDAAKTVSQAFLGVRLECAQCHHHPFEKWGQDDFYGLAAFFNGVERKPLGAAKTGDVAKHGDAFVFHSGYRETRMPLTEQPVAMRAPDAPPPAAAARAPGSDPRQELARWLTARENPWFARLVANRLWKHYLGRGLVEPEDDLRSTNPPTNEPLLDYLASQLVERGFDLKAVMRLILQSRVYQLASTANATNQGDEQNFSRHYVRRLPAEVLLDAVCQVTESPEPFPGRPHGTRAIELWDNRLPSYFLDIFGRSERASPCECGRSGEPTMAQALHLMNSPEIEKKIGSPTGRAARLAAASMSRDQILEELCLAALGRPPGANERTAAERLFAQAPRPEATQDLLWTLVNSYDFLFVP
jgi:hypothetical protein